MTPFKACFGEKSALQFVPEGVLSYYIIISITVYGTLNFGHISYPLLQQPGQLRVTVAHFPSLYDSQVAYWVSLCPRMVRFMCDETCRR